MRRIRSLAAVERYFREGTNQVDFYDFLVSELRRRSVGRSDDYKINLRGRLNALINVFKLGTELPSEKQLKWDYLWTEERKPSVRAFVETRDVFSVAGHGHLALCKVNVSLSEMSEDACISFLINRREYLEAYEWSVEDLSYYEKGEFRNNRS